MSETQDITECSHLECRPLCPMHQAAPYMLKALDAINTFVPNHDHDDLGEHIAEDCPFCQGQVATAKARGERVL